MASARFVAAVLAATALAAALYAALILCAKLPFNSATWLLGEDIAGRGWMACALASAAYSAAAWGVWRARRWARWLAVALTVAALLSTVPAVSAAVIEMRPAGIAWWGAWIVLRAALLYLLLGARG